MRPAGAFASKDCGRTRLRIAVADDDPETLALLCEILHGPDTDIVQAATGAELVVHLSEHGPFDIVVTDIDMPWMEGLDVLKAAREAQIDVPVVFVSGLVRPELPEAVAALGNAVFLRKPIVVKELRKAVAALALRR